ncbi:MAG: hypothetical protein ABIK65_09225 [Candidatus Eisenbacteria bacterium]
MARLEDLTRGALVKGIDPSGPVTVVDAKWHGTVGVELTYKEASGRLDNRMLYRGDEPALEVVEGAIDRYGDPLDFALNSKLEVDRDLFEEKGEVWAVIEWLATVYHDSKTGVQSCPNLDMDLRATCDWWYRAHQKEATVEKYREWYHARRGNKAYALEEHVGTGSSKDPRHTMRIAFARDPEEKKVVIGYMGQHQQTDAT